MPKLHKQPCLTDKKPDKSKESMFDVVDFFDSQGIEY